MESPTEWDCTGTRHVLTTPTLRLVRVEREHESHWVESYNERAVPVRPPGLEQDGQSTFANMFAADRAWEPTRQLRTPAERRKGARGPRRVFYVEAWTTFERQSGSFVGASLLQQMHEHVIGIGGWT